MEPPVLQQYNGAVLEIILSAPDRGNVVSNEVLSLIKQAIIDAETNAECRVILLKGSGGVFSRGMDFSALLKQRTNINEEWSKPYMETVLAIRDSAKPVIAAVDGEVLAGGMGLMLASDIVLATSRSLFGLSEVLFGIIPAYVLPLLMERVSYKKGRYLVISSKKVTGREAFSLGLVDELFDDEKTLNKGIKTTIKRLLFSRPEALQLVKSYSDKISGSHIRKALEEANKTLTALLQDNKNIDAINAFLQGELPEWCRSYHGGTHE